MTNEELVDQYKNSKNSYEFFYDDDDETKVTQIRFHLDDDPEIKNKCLCISKIHFKAPVILFYERHRTIGNKKIIEFYENDEMSMYEEITIENAVRVVKVFSTDGHLMCEAKT